MPIDNCNHRLFKHRGQTLHTWGKDTTGLITYTLNSQGFRSRCEYDWSPEYAFFGSSSVFGIGVDDKNILVSYFNNSQNYGLSGIYSNQESVINLKNFLNSGLYTNTYIVFFWTDRINEDIVELAEQVQILVPNALQISQGKQYPGLINLMPDIDQDVSGTHPGPKTHQLWAKTIKELYEQQS